MPTENERKWVLTIESERKIKRRPDCVIHIRQGYLILSKGMSLRVREEQQNGKTRYKFCYKQKVNGRVIEIEKKIDKRDFDDLWKIALNKLDKIRYVIGEWEVDYFYDHDNIYFAMAEIEMPEGETEPKKIPKFINDNLLYAVPVGDDNYSSKRISCVKHAKKIYLELANK